MPQDFGKGDGNLSLGRTMAVRKWVIEFCLFGVILIVERVSNGSFLQSPWVFPSLPLRGFHSLSWARLKKPATSHARSMKTDAIREITQLREGKGSGAQRDAVIWA